MLKGFYIFLIYLFILMLVCFLFGIDTTNRSLSDIVHVGVNKESSDYFLCPFY